MFTAGHRAPRSARRWSKPEGAKWAEPLKVIDQPQRIRFDGAGYLKPGYRHIFVVSADGGSPRQLTFGAVDDGGELSWSADGRSILFSADRAAWLAAPRPSTRTSGAWAPTTRR